MVFTGLSMTNPSLRKCPYHPPWKTCKATCRISKKLMTKYRLSDIVFPSIIFVCVFQHLKTTYPHYAFNLFPDNFDPNWTCTAGKSTGGLHPDPFAACLLCWSLLRGMSWFSGRMRGAAVCFLAGPSPTLWKYTIWCIAEYCIYINNYIYIIYT